MSESTPNEKRQEPALVKLYTEITGAPENTARGVFMFVCQPDNESPEDGSEKPKGPAVEPGAGEAPGPSGVVPTLALLLTCFALNRSLASATNSPSAQLPEGHADSATNAAAIPSRADRGNPNVNHRTDTPPVSWFSQPLSLADAVNLALHQNPNVRRAQKDLEETQGIVIETRAIALPSVGINSSYNAVQKTDIDTFVAPIASPGSPGVSFATFGTPQNWSSQVKVVQSIYQGGRMLSALRAARLAKEQSLLNYQTALAGTVLDVQLAYYDVLLAAEQITVQEASVELLTRELADTTRRFDAGTVPRFNVLRAEVELANAKPRLIRARNDLRIAKNNLANRLGFNLPRETLEDIPLTLSDKLTAEPYDLSLSRAVGLAFEQRTELGALGKAEALRKEDLVNAKAGYKPVIQGYFGYDAHNSMLSQDLTDIRYGWIAGAQLTWNIFDGLRTQGRIREAAARYERAGVDLEDTARQIELEVRTAYSYYIEAREVLDSQKKAVEEAEEALRLARARYEAGTGTQLDVLSAQTALTEARSTLVQALHDYAAARARLERAVGNNVPRPPTTN